MPYSWVPPSQEPKVMAIHREALWTVRAWQLLPVGRVSEPPIYNPNGWWWSFLIIFFLFWVEATESQPSLFSSRHVTKRARCITFLGLGRKYMNFADDYFVFCHQSFKYFCSTYTFSPGWLVQGPCGVLALESTAQIYQFQFSDEGKSHHGYLLTNRNFPFSRTMIYVNFCLNKYSVSFS